MKKLLFILSVFLVGCTPKNGFVSVNEIELEHVLVERDAFRNDVLWVLMHIQNYTLQEAMNIIDKRNNELYEIHERGKLWIKNPHKDYNLSVSEKLRSINVNLDKLILETSK